MKVEWNKKYTTIAVYTIIVALVITLIVLFFLNISFFGEAIGTFFSIIMPFIVGFAVAYLLLRPAKFIERKWFAFVELRKPHPKARRMLAIFTTYIIALGLLALLVYAVIPQLAQSATLLFINIPTYLDSLENTIVTWLQSLSFDTTALVSFVEDFIEGFLNFTNLIDSLLDQLPTFITSVGTGIFNFFVGLIVSVYVIYSRERFMRQGKKFCYAIFKEKLADKFISVLRYSNNVFLGYIMGTLSSTALVSISTFVFMLLLRMPYPVLITVIIAVTNLIPFFGPIIGAIPSIIILLMVNPLDALIFLIFIIVLQQVDGNIFLPKFIGMHTGISAFWVLFSLLLFGGLFGFWGLILAVPVFAVIYSLIAALINHSLEKKGVPPEKFIYPRDIYFEKESSKWSFKRKKKEAG